MDTNLRQTTSPEKRELETVKYPSVALIGSSDDNLLSDKLGLPG